MLQTLERHSYVPTICAAFEFFQQLPLQAAPILLYELWRKWEIFGILIPYCTEVDVEIFLSFRFLCNGVT